MGGTFYNVTPHPVSNNGALFKQLYNYQFNIHKLRVWGCSAQVKLLPEKQSKIQNRPLLESSLDSTMIHPPIGSWIQLPELLRKVMMFHSMNSHSYNFEKYLRPFLISSRL